MSIPVDLTELVRVLEDFDYAYLTTTDEQGRAHVVATSPVVDRAGVTIGQPGRRSRANAEARPHVTLVWPPFDRTGYTLIVDGTCKAADPDVLRVTPTRAVLHRPATPTSAPAGSCGSDCVEVLRGS